MCEIKYQFGIRVKEELSVLDNPNIVSEDMEDWIVKYMDDNEDLFIPIDDLGLTEEDINDPNNYIIIGDDEDLNEDIENVGTYTQLGVQEKVIKLYRYILYPNSTNTSGYSNGVGPNTRRFCKELIRRSNLSLLTKDSIERLNSSNPGFGIRGANTYSVFNWRGGVNCKHIWVKYLYQPSTNALVKDVKQPTQTSPGRVPRYNKK